MVTEQHSPDFPPPFNRIVNLLWYVHSMKFQSQTTRWCYLASSYVHYTLVL
ncbi:uncharacterized protein METZ01_LOCUS362494, partial [marine metagenome]